MTVSVPDAQVSRSEAGASSRPDAMWLVSDWTRIESEMRRLQVRIAKATKEGRWGKVQALQRLLTRSYSGKMLAVKRVKENRGKRTPGVDGKIWSSPQPNRRGWICCGIAGIARNRCGGFISRRAMARNALSVFRPCSIGRCKLCGSWLSSRSQRPGLTETHMDFGRRVRPPTPSRIVSARSPGRTVRSGSWRATSVAASIT